MITLILRIILITNLILLFSCSSNMKSQENKYVEQIFENQIILRTGEKLEIPQRNENNKTTIILVRHAEEFKNMDNPKLNEKGLARAEKLKEVLSDIKLDKVYSTNYHRTQLTAHPTQFHHNLEMNYFNHARLESVSKFLLEEDKGKTILVVGHTDTTYKLLNNLCGKEIVNSINDSDYENIYLLNFSQEEIPKIYLLKY